MLSVIDRLGAANAKLTKESMDLQTEISQRGKAGQRIFLPGDSVLVGMKEGLGAFESALEVVVREAKESVAPPELAAIHSALLKAFRMQLDGASRARAGVESIDFAEVGKGLELRGEGIADMQEQGVRLSRFVSGS